MAKIVASNRTPKEMTPWECRSRVTDAVLASLSLQDSQHLLPSDLETTKVFEAFYQLRNRYPKWLECLYFEGQPGYRISRGLEDVLFSLGAFGLVTVENKDYRFLRLDDNTKAEIKKHVICKLSDDLPILKRKSNDFVELMKK
jgi:hypothetical protein